MTFRYIYSINGTVNQPVNCRFHTDKRNIQVIGSVVAEGRTAQRHRERDRQIETETERQRETHRDTETQRHRYTDSYLVVLTPLAWSTAGYRHNVFHYVC